MLFYSLPEHPQFYSELVNLLEEGGAAGAGGGLAAAGLGGGVGHSTVTALFCSWDLMALERVVGAGRAKKMLRSESGTFMFC